MSRIIHSTSIGGCKSETIYYQGKAVLGTWSVLSVNCCVLICTCLLLGDKIAHFKNIRVMILIYEQVEFKVKGVKQKKGSHLIKATIHNKFYQII